MSISLLRPQWFILVSIFIIITETLTINLFWKDVKQAFKVAMLANLGSAVVALPLLHTCLGEWSVWFYLIVVGENIVTEGLPLLDNLIAVLMMISFFMIPPILSIGIENAIGKALRAPEKRLTMSIIVANFITYTVIITSLLGLGILFGMTKRDPISESWDFFGGNLVQFIPIDSFLASIQLLFLLLVGVVLSLVLIIYFIKVNLRKESMF